MNLNKDSSQLFAFSRYRSLNRDENGHRKPNKTDLDFIKEKKESLRYKGFYFIKSRNLNIISRSFVSFSDPTGCTVVVVGGEYIHRLDEVMKNVDEIVDEMNERIPEAVFVFLNDEKYPENIFSTDNRHVSSPTMVKSYPTITD